MGTTKTNVINLALQLCGAGRVDAVEDSNAALEVDVIYADIKDAELRANAWGFAKKRENIAAHAIVPAFNYQKAFPLPSDYLRYLKPARAGLDWQVEVHQGVLAILTNQDTGPLQLRYIYRAPENMFDALFTVMLSCALAWQVVESITQSNSKRDAIRERYIDYRREARRLNAFEKIPDKQPVDSWISGMQSGRLVDSDWGEE